VILGVHRIRPDQKHPLHVVSASIVGPAEHEVMVLRHHTVGEAQCVDFDLRVDRPHDGDRGADLLLDVLIAQLPQRDVRDSMVGELEAVIRQILYFPLFHTLLLEQARKVAEDSRETEVGMLVVESLHNSYGAIRVDHLLAVLFDVSELGNSRVVESEDNRSASGRRVDVTAQEVAIVDKAVSFCVERLKVAPEVVNTTGEAPFFVRNAVVLENHDHAELIRPYALLQE